jgi:mono/diheme cytochrome c family protein
MPNVGLRLLLIVIAIAALPAFAQGDAKRGAYLAKAAGCFGCHTEDKKDATPFAGGRALKTPFGTFYGPNITSDPKAGIGRFSEADFIRALRRGERPDGSSYFPAFPYPSFTRMTDQDLKDLWAYVKTLAPSPQPSRAHELDFPYGWRALVTAWKWLFFEPGPAAPDPKLDALQQRGRYLVTALGHCGECHTPRNFLGAPQRDRFLAGGKGPEGKSIPNITPTRLKKWSDAELEDFLTTGVYSDGDVPAEAMAEVIRNTTSQLTPEDLNAMVAYLRAVPPLPEAPKEK